MTSITNALLTCYGTEQLGGVPIMWKYTKIKRSQTVEQRPDPELVEPI